MRPPGGGVYPRRKPRRFETFSRLLRISQEPPGRPEKGVFMRFLTPRSAAAGLLAVFGAVRIFGAEPEPPALRLPKTARPTGYVVDLTIDPARTSFRGTVDVGVRLYEKTSYLW